MKDDLVRPPIGETSELLGKRADGSNRTELISPLSTLRLSDADLSVIADFRPDFEMPNPDGRFIPENKPITDDQIVLIARKIRSIPEMRRQKGEGQLEYLSRLNTWVKSLTGSLGAGFRHFGDNWEGLQRLESQLLYLEARDLGEERRVADTQDAVQARLEALEKQLRERERQPPEPPAPPPPEPAKPPEPEIVVPPPESKPPEPEVVVSPPEPQLIVPPPEESKPVAPTKPPEPEKGVVPPAPKVQEPDSREHDAPTRPEPKRPDRRVRPVGEPRKEPRAKVIPMPPRKRRPSGGEPRLKRHESDPPQVALSIRQKLLIVVVTLVGFTGAGAALYYNLSDDMRRDVRERVSKFLGDIGDSLRKILSTEDESSPPAPPNISPQNDPEIDRLVEAQRKLERDLQSQNTPSTSTPIPALDPAPKPDSKDHAVPSNSKPEATPIAQPNTAAEASESVLENPYSRVFEVNIIDKRKWKKKTIPAVMLEDGLLVTSSEYFPHGVVNVTSISFLNKDGGTEKDKLRRQQWDWFTYGDFAFIRIKGMKDMGAHVVEQGNDLQDQYAIMTMTQGAGTWELKSCRKETFDPSKNSLFVLLPDAVNLASMVGAPVFEDGKVFGIVAPDSEATNSSREVRVQAFGPGFLDWYKGEKARYDKQHH